MPMRRAAAPSQRRRARPGPPALQLLLPGALVPRKRRGAAPRKRRAAFPDVAGHLAALPSAPRIRRPTLADLRGLMVLAWTAVALADAEAKWEAEAEAQAGAGGSSAPAAGEKHSAASSSSLPLAAAEEKPNAPPLAAVEENPSMSSMAPPLEAVDENLSMPMAPLIPAVGANPSMPITAPVPAVDENPSMPIAPPVPAVDENPSMSIAPPPAKKLCSAVPAASAAAGSSAMQLADEDDELELGEIPPEKPATADSNANSARESLLGKGKGKETAGEETATGGGADAAAVEKEKKEREVFVGCLHRDAREEDVRAALSVFGEITEVRMIMDDARIKNKGYCFVAYREPAMARKALAEFGNVKILGKPCRVEVTEGTEKPKTAQKDHVIQNPNRGMLQPSPILADSSYITSWRPLAISPSSSYALPPLMPIPERYLALYHYGNNNVYLPAGPNYGVARPWERSQMRQDGSGRSRQPKRSRN